MIKLKFRNTRENLPTFQLNDLEDSGLFDTSSLNDQDKLTLRLVNVGGITSDVTFTVDDDSGLAKADGWNAYLFSLERNNKPFEVGVCAATEGEEFIATAAEEEEFEEFDEEEDSADEEGFDNSDDSDEDDFDDSDDEEEAPAPTPIRAATARTVTVVAAAPVARTAQAPEKKTYKTDVSSADILAAFYDNSENKAAAARELNMSPRTFGRRLEQALAERRTRSKPAAKKTPAKSSKNKRAASKKNGSKKRR